MRYDRLDVWMLSKDLSVDVYRQLTDLQDFGFKNQITRSALSIPSNIAEGAERLGDKERRNFFNYAKGSAGEFRTQVIIGVEIGYIHEELGAKWIATSERLARMLGAFIVKLA